MTISREELRQNLAETIGNFLEASRRNRKASDVDALYSKLETELRRGWREQLEDFKKEWGDSGIRATFEAKRPGPSDKQMDALWNRSKKRGDKRHEKAIDENVKKALPKGAKSAIADLVKAGFNYSFDLKHPRAVKFLKKYGANRVTGISETSRNRIKRIVVNMAEEGKSYSEIGRAIEAEIEGWTKRGTGAVRTRGELIAVTEVGTAYEEGRQIVMADFHKKGVKTVKEWITADDERVCEICEPAEAEGWIPSNQAFINGMPGPLGHPGCRCDLLLDVA